MKILKTILIMSLFSTVSNAEESVVSSTKVIPSEYDFNAFSDIKGLADLNFENKNDVWLHDQISNTLQWCESNNFIDSKDLNKNWFTAGTKWFNTWKKPSSEDASIICNSIISTGVNLTCETPQRIFNKHRNINFKKYKEEYVLGYGVDLINDSNFVGKSKCSYNDFIKSNTDYRANIVVEYDIEPLEDIGTETIIMRNGNSKDVHSVPALLKAKNKLFNNIKRKFVVIPVN